MPDTGAPWNIPYVEAADLVSDWPADSLALANAIADGLDEAPNAGIGSNVVQAVKTDVFTVAATTFTDVTGLSVTITPSSATSKILLIAYVNFAGTSSNGGGVLIAGGNSSTFLGDADGVRVQAAAWKTIFTNSEEDMGSAGITYLDSPATASPVTYTVQVRAGNGGTVAVNRSRDDANTTQFGRTASSITAIEVAA